MQVTAILYVAILSIEVSSIRRKEKHRTTTSACGVGRDFD